MFGLIMFCLNSYVAVSAQKTAKHIMDHFGLTSPNKLTEVH